VKLRKIFSGVCCECAAYLRPHRQLECQRQAQTCPHTGLYCSRDTFLQEVQIKAPKLPSRSVALPHVLKPVCRVHA